MLQRARELIFGVRRDVRESEHSRQFGDGRARRTSIYRIMVALYELSTCFTFRNYFDRYKLSILVRCSIDGTRRSNLPHDIDFCQLLIVIPLIAFHSQYQYANKIARRHPMRYSFVRPEHRSITYVRARAASLHVGTTVLYSSVATVRFQWSELGA